MLHQLYIMSSTITETSETRPVYTIFIGNIPNATGVRDKLVAVVTRLVRAKFGGFSLTVPGENPASARAEKGGNAFRLSSLRRVVLLRA